MKKLLLTLILAVVSSSAMAEWTRVDEIVGDSTIYYFDNATIHKTGSRVKMMVLYDFKLVWELNGRESLSSINQYEYDCKKNQIRRLNSNLFSKNMGTGTVVESSNRMGKWKKVVPESVGEVSWKYACGK